MELSLGVKLVGYRSNITRTPVAFPLSCLKYSSRRGYPVAMLSFGINLDNAAYHYYGLALVPVCRDICRSVSRCIVHFKLALVVSSWEPVDSWHLDLEGSLELSLCVISLCAIKPWALKRI